MEITIKQLKTHFQNLIQQDELSHAYLFVESVRANALPLAQWLAQRLFCDHLTTAGFPCGQCHECQRIIEGNNPDYLVLNSTTKTISVDDTRHLKEELSKSGYGSWRIFVIEDADKMTIPAANSLLKFLEEPVSQVLIILTTTQESQILPTIRSRVQTMMLPEPDLTQRVQSLSDLGFNQELSQLLAQTTLNQSQLAELAEDEQLKEKISSFAQWWPRLALGDALAFPQVQTTILPAFKGNLLQDLCQEMLLIVFSDLFTAKFSLAQPLKWPQQEPSYQHVAGKITSGQLTASLTEVLQMKQLLHANVTFQNVLEQLSLQFFMIKEGNFK
ncbi:hypothetical protein [Lapidilactobacillus gannanensis]|uniref:DNA polymerase III subunit delta n=1 Tax=Lapidilactobacillus gannanensis TaxID=2486002 RepID=A0ABW4BQB8_9LACO|nr:hypothetical protein [Lapidilactobacillus gannanensis]